jgi:cysteinyl-tRNA synthetase
LTPSAQAHLGHARSFMFFDVLRRYLLHLGYDVTFVQNVTDIDDRSIRAAIETGEDWRSIVKRNYDSFRDSMNKLGVLVPDSEPHATAYIPEIQVMIRDLVAKSYAYATDDGIYFNVKKDKGYGKLSHKKIDELLVGARIEENERKQDPLDFALWKYAKPGEPQWEFEGFGAGRPGWHIECSAMAHALLGEPLDIHGGGFDLIFPHHENEIAQTEAATGKALSRRWVHGGLLTFENKKMSKSLGNYEPLYEMLERYDPRALRFLFLQTGYRKPMNFTEESIAGATSGLQRLLKAYAATASTTGGGSSGVDLARARFFAALDDDVNTAGAVSVLFDLIADTPLLASEGEAVHTFLKEALSLCGIDDLDSPLAVKATDLDAAIVARLSSALAGVMSLNGDSPEAAIEKVIAARNAARKSKDFALADKLRDALAEQRIVLADSRDGTSWSVDA